MYKEQIFDLLNPSSAFVTSADMKAQEEASDLKLRWDAARGRCRVENLFEYRPPADSDMQGIWCQPMGCLILFQCQGPDIS